MKFEISDKTGEFILLAADGTVLEADQRTLQHIGLHRLAGRRLCDVLTPASRARIGRSLDLCLNGESRIEELEFRTRARLIAKLFRVELDGGMAAIAAMTIAAATGEQPWRSAAGSSGSGAMALLGKGVSLQLGRLQTQMADLRAKYEDARLASMIDTPTGLYNRAGLDDWLQKEVSRGGAESPRLFLVYLDLDDFKRFNDTYGHILGDKVLRVLARRLMACRQTLCAARVGGDEFAILARHDLADGPLADALSELMPRIFREARIDGLHLRFSGSAGFSVFNDDAFDITGLKEHADSALVEAKRSGKNRVRPYDSELADRQRRRCCLERDLPDAISTGSIRAAYQPIISACGRSGYGVEVLSRWNHYEFGYVSPDEFVSLASEMGLIGALDLDVARTALRELAPLIGSGALDFISLNASPLELVRHDHIDQLIEAVQASGIPPGAICVEVTESEFISDIEGASRAITRLKKAGMKIALDDYGTGYSNLRALLNLPVDKLKIDRSLVQGLATDERTMRVVLSIIHLARIFNADLVAEGIETREQAAVARAVGCHYLQGFAFSSPVYVDDLTSWLDRRDQRHPKAVVTAEPPLQFAS